MGIRVQGNRPIETLPGDLTRPTSSKVRQAVGNIWRERLAGCRWLDLCAGSGAIGAEALGWGAGYVLGIERAAAACQVVRNNWRLLAKPEQRFEVIMGDVVKVLRRLEAQPFDCIYFDPPYASGLYKTVLEVISDRDLLATTGQLIAEHGQPQRLPEQVGRLYRGETRSYGQTAITFYGRLD